MSLPLLGFGLATKARSTDAPVATVEAPAVEVPAPPAPPAPPPPEAAPAAPRTAAPRQDERFRATIDILCDESRSPAERIDALNEARAIAGSGDLRAPLARTVHVLLGERMANRIHDKGKQRLVAELWSAVGDDLAPWTNLVPTARRYLAEWVPHVERLAVLHALERIETSGLEPDLELLLEEPYAGSGPQDDAPRAAIESSLARVARKLPPAEAVDLLAALALRSRIDWIRVRAVHHLGDLAVERDPRRISAWRVQSLLGELARLKRPPDHVLAVAATRALLRHGSWTGVAQALDRLAGAERAADDYAVVCAAAHATRGFAGLEPAAFEGATAKTRDAAVAAARVWWEGARTRSRDDVTLDALRDAGVSSVPRTPFSREVVMATIDGLDTGPDSLRGAALDLFVRKTGRFELARIYPLADEAVLSNPAKTQALREKQAAAAARLREWWMSVQEEAVLERGVWRTPR